VLFRGSAIARVVISRYFRAAAVWDVEA